MKKRILVLITSLLITYTSQSQVSLDYYLPPNTSLNPAIPTPQSIIGHEVGDWHISHDKLVQYMYALAEASDRVEIEEYARSHENRPLLILKISAPANIQNLESIRTEHLKISDYNQSSRLELSKLPLVAYLGYSIHGNEPSGSNAALLVAYYLAAAKGTEIENWLKNTVILLDPSYNPDGLNRFASWVNGKKGMNLVTDPNHIEQNEPWPRGRTNHYWFDLNRDWLPVQHPESQGRIKQYHKWKPNVLTDHHEMGTNGTFFFQPGIPSRNNPLTPDRTYELTQKIANYHARALDGIGSLYYAKESYDDFYIGKGSSYPDVNGAVGILFEQASARGHAQQSDHGILTFPFAIRNHFTTSLSTLRAANELRSELLDHQQKFYADIPAMTDKEEVKAYVFSASNDNSKLKAFLSILETHQVEVYQLNKSFDGFNPNHSFIIPLKQNQNRMIKGIFETRTQFEDSLFYDVSAWTLPLAFDLAYKAVKGKSYTAALIGEQIYSTELQKTFQTFESSSYSYAFHWQDAQSPALLYDIQKLGLRTKVATSPWADQNGQSFERGSILIPVQNQPITSSEIYDALVTLSEKHDIPITSLSSGNTDSYQLGSPKFKTLAVPKPLLIIGEEVNAYEAGEVWHLLDQRMGMALPMITIDKCNSISLKSYNTIIMVGGSYGTLAQAKIKSWLQNGGNIITTKSAGKWISEAGLSKIKYKKIARDSTQKYQPYHERGRTNGAQRIGGTIFETHIDLTHPLGFGFADEKLPVFKRGTQLMELAKNPYAQPAHYTANPLLAGYVSEENLKHIPNTPAVGLSAFGKGMIISIQDNPNFRAYWYGTNRLFLNALFFSGMIEAGSAR
ncbi:Zinc carboxypeptidase [Reichenbachiella faecimaris]|uniref:Zinc carboxypeptidase n=1 Tax=Reichenbachiella faecimaris TaxID=692418 RepID=A0A1W2GMT8_REIFA|nr:M14 metallopeptidase family protein [Reichenbachiella faecimaris]SMD37874.1 Zinc carboxypeptidase [Reichenbachiella faecimaris]